MKEMGFKGQMSVVAFQGDYSGIIMPTEVSWQHLHPHR